MFSNRQNYKIVWINITYFQYGPAVKFGGSNWKILEQIKIMTDHSWKLSLGVEKCSEF